ncbi:MAG: Spy0128 family protein, partial [Clostridium sp.]
NGKINFNELTFDKEGTYLYEIKEVKGTATDIIYDEAIYEVEIKVERVGNEYKATVNVKKNGVDHTGDIVFENKTIDKEVEEDKEIPKEEIVDEDTPKTGDNRRTLLYTVLVMISLIGILMIFFKREKETH